MSMGLWGHISGSSTRPTETEAAAEFDTNAEKCIGIILLHCKDPIQQQHVDSTSPQNLWNALKNQYGESTSTTIYKDFKEAISIRLRAETDPTPQVDKMAAAFERLRGANIVVPEALQAMILLAALPTKWEHLVPIVTIGSKISTLAFKSTADVIINAFNGDSIKKGGHQANKLSAIKRKRGNPHFSNQKEGSQQQGGNQQNRSKGKQRGKRGSGKSKHQTSDQHTSDHHHSHIADVAIRLPTPQITADVSVTDVRKHSIAPPLKHTGSPYKTVNEALSLTKRIGARATIQTTKNLEQRIIEARSEGYELMDDDQSNSDVDMIPSREKPQTQEDLEWDLEDAISHLSDNEPLDWGSDLEDDEYVLSLKSLRFVHDLKESPQILNAPNQRSRSNRGRLKLNLSIYVCEHHQSYALCGICKGNRPQKTNALWLLDSGASAHFTFNMDDFIEYTPASKDERIPVSTAANTIYVRGKGTVLLSHNVGDQMITTRLHPVLYIPEITTRILSLGTFLQQGLNLSGHAPQISLAYKHETLIVCKPLIYGQTIYWLDATTRSQRAHQLIYTVDYDLMHRRLGHPSKDVMSHARNTVKGFPDTVTIPSNAPVCPGCAQGKMPAAAHPPLVTRASRPFEHVHSDLKSFPVISYHK